MGFCFCFVSSFKWMDFSRASANQAVTWRRMFLRRKYRTRLVNVRGWGGGSIKQKTTLFTMRNIMRNYTLIMNEGGFGAAYVEHWMEEAENKMREISLSPDDPPRVWKFRMDGNWIQWMRTFAGLNESQLVRVVPANLLFPLTSGGSFFLRESFLLFLARLQNPALMSQDGILRSWCGAKRFLSLPRVKRVSSAE